MTPAFAVVFVAPAFRVHWSSVFSCWGGFAAVERTAAKAADLLSVEIVA